MGIIYEVRYEWYWYDCHKVVEEEHEEFDNLPEALEKAEMIRAHAELDGITLRDKELKSLQKRDQFSRDVSKFLGVFRVERVY